MKRSREPEEDLDPGPQQHGHDPLSVRSELEALQPIAKITELDSAVTDDESTYGDDGSRSTEYESHYNNFHTNRCLECRKNFPSEHLLGVHIEECHDPLVVVKRDKGEHTYSCFVEGCERKCLTHQKRRRHMIDKHMYPKNFFFAVTKEGIDGRRSLLIESGHSRRRSSIAAQSKDSRRRASLQEGKNPKPGNDKPQAAPSSDEDDDDDEEEEAPDTDMSDLTGAMASLQFVPPSVRFGRGRAGFVRK